MVDAATPDMMHVANPFMTRGHRLSFDLSATHIFYGVKENLVAQGVSEEHKSAIYAAN